jgi:hypothetical protein
MFHSIAKNLIITLHYSLLQDVLRLAFLLFSTSLISVQQLHISYHCINHQDPYLHSGSPRFYGLHLLLYMWQTSNNSWLQEGYFYESMSSIHFQHCSIIINVHYNTFYNYYIITHNTRVFIIERFVFGCTA